MLAAKVSVGQMNLRVCAPMLKLWPVKATLAVSE
jgi:hypothetical protein